MVPNDVPVFLRFSTLRIQETLLGLAPEPSEARNFKERSVVKRHISPKSSRLEGPAVLSAHDNKRCGYRPTPSLVLRVLSWFLAPSYVGSIVVQLHLAPCHHFGARVCWLGMGTTQHHKNAMCARDSSPLDVQWQPVDDGGVEGFCGTGAKTVRLPYTRCLGYLPRHGARSAARFAPPVSR